MKVVHPDNGYWCDECNNKYEEVIQLGSDEDVSWICKDCLKKALEMLE